MDRLQAEKYDLALVDRIEEHAGKYEVDGILKKSITDEFVEFYPEDEIRELISLGVKSVSYKPGNVKIEFKRAILNGIEYVATVNRPESIFNYIQLLIITVLFIKSVTKIELSEVESHMVYWLHKENWYQDGIEEELLINNLQEYFKDNNIFQEVVDTKIVNAINHLYQINVIDINEGKVYLREKIWGKME